ncbi:M23 family metallopeptidase, partial [Burkholderia cenocepacia]|uniref:M23 family metallopeptidase n=1 Tax=Burkholderia cenocepacia TaxID=95486 RepID=UPI003D231AC5|nr:hypothetical protein [Burkholderia cenocepacia]
GAYYTLDGSPLEAAAFTMPVKWTRISSFFGERIHPLSQAMAFHTGVDLAAPVIPTEPIRCPCFTVSPVLSPRANADRCA